MMYPHVSKPKVEKNIQIPDHILKELLTASELRMLKNRWQIINLLEDGLSIRKVAGSVKVGTDTVVRVARMMEKARLHQTLAKERRSKLPFKARTPWIFGKSE